MTINFNLLLTIVVPVFNINICNCKTKMSRIFKMLTLKKNYRLCHVISLKRLLSVHCINSRWQVQTYSNRYFSNWSLKSIFHFPNKAGENLPKIINVKEFQNEKLVVYYKYFSHSLWYLNILKRYILSGLLLEGIIVILLFSVSIHLLRVPPPDSATVNTIIGKDPALIDDSDDDNKLVKTIAHRGAGLDAPENSLVAFKMCNDKGLNFVEFDVTLTADGVPVVFHDNTLERMADCCDNISEKTYAELKQFDISVKHPFSNKYTGTNIPTLEETVCQLLSSGQNMFIDVKDNNMKMVSVITNLYEKYPELYLRAITTSFYPNIIYFIRRRNSRIVCSLAWRPYPFSHTSYSYAAGKGPKRANVWYKHYLNMVYDVLHETLLPLLTYHLLGISLVLLHKDVICGRAVTEWQEKGIRVVAWTINHPVEKQHFARILKVTYMTDTLTGETTTHSSVN